MVSFVPFKVQEPSKPELIVNPRDDKVLQLNVALLTIGVFDT